VNVANLGRRPYRSLSSDVVGVLEGLGLLLRGEVIWRKAQGSTGSCAWGSFQRPGNPVLRDLTERVVVASKGRFDRAISAREREVRGLPCVASLSKDEFMEATTDVWELPSERATVVGHPAPFPVALPERLIHLYTYRGDLVLDPFMGSGTTAVAAVRTGRHFVGFDTDADYVDRAQARVEDERVRLASTDGRPPAAFATPALPPAPSPTGADEDQFTRALREGGAAKDVAKALLECCGFTGVRADVRFPGLTVSFRALDAAEQPWLFDVVGGFTSTAPGLRRAEAFWRALGKAAVVHEIEPEVPLVLLTSAAPLKNTPAEAALRAVTGPGQAVRAVVCIGTPRGRDDLERLVAEEVATSAAPR
jgi:site-specific DNA-methyltransferase (adenine-specific)